MSLAIFTTLQFYDAVPELGSQVLTIVCISLPLSAIWAGVASESNLAANGRHGRQSFVQEEFYGSTLHSTSTNTTACETSRKMSVCTHSKERDFGSANTTVNSRWRTLTEDDHIDVDQPVSHKNESAADNV